MPLRKARKILLSALLTCLVLLLGTVGTGAWYVTQLLDGMQEADGLIHTTPEPGLIDQLDPDGNDLVPSDGTVDFKPLEETLNKELPDSIKNILLMGLDGGKSALRSDAIAVLSVNTLTGEIKLTNILRDLRVDIEGRAEPDKIAHAHVYGRAALAIKTVNETFDLNIEDYISVNFFSMANLIDAMGGVTIRVRAEEVPYINEGVREVNRLAGLSDLTSGYLYLYETKTVTLTGKQAVAYGRIRKLDSDMERVSRQQKVLEALFNKAMSGGAGGLVSMVENLAPYVKTSLTMDEMMTLASVVLTKKGGLETTRIPADGEYTTVTKPLWFEVADMEKTLPRLHQFIYGEDSLY